MVHVWIGLPFKVAQIWVSFYLKVVQGLFGALPQSGTGLGLVNTSELDDTVGIGPNPLKQTQPAWVGVTTQVQVGPNTQVWVWHYLSVAPGVVVEMYHTPNPLRANTLSSSRCENTGTCVVWRRGYGWALPQTCTGKVVSSPCQCSQPEWALGYRYRECGVDNSGLQGSSRDFNPGLNESCWPWMPF